MSILEILPLFEVKAVSIERFKIKLSLLPQLRINPFSVLELLGELLLQFEIECNMDSALVDSYSPPRGFAPLWSYVFARRELLRRTLLRRALSRRALSRRALLRWAILRLS